MNNLLTNLALASITPSPNNPRKVFAPEAMTELVASVKTHGVVQPILVRQLPDGDYELIAGERRYRAATEAMLDTIPAMVVHASEQEALELGIIENLQRQDISAMEEAEGYQRWLTLSGLSIDALVGKLDKSRSYVYGTIKLLDLTTSVADRVRAGEMSRSVALLLSRINDAARQEDMARRVMDVSLERSYEQKRSMTYREALKFVREKATKDLTRVLFALDASYGNLIPCSACPKRSCNDMLILAEHENNPDVCTDPVCHDVKVEMHLAPMIQALKDEGHKVLLGIVTPNGYKVLDDYVSSRKGYEPIKKILGKKLLPKPPTSWVSTVTGLALVVIADKELNQILKDNDLDHQSAQKNTSASAKAVIDKAWHQSLKYEVAARQRLAGAALRLLHKLGSLADKWNKDILTKVITSGQTPDDYEKPSADAWALLDLKTPAGDALTIPEHYSHLYSDIGSDHHAEIIVANALEAWLGMAEDDHGPYRMNDEICNYIAALLGLVIEVTDVDRETAEARWPSPAKTPAEAFAKLFSGDKIRKPSKRKAKAATADKASPGDDGTPIERPLEELYPDKTKSPGPGYYWNEISGRWGFDLAYRPDEPHADQAD